MKTKGARASSADVVVPKAAYAGIEPLLTGGITYASVVPSAAAVLRSEEETTTIKHIVQREGTIAALRRSLRRLEARFEVSIDVLEQLQLLRQQTIDVCECITAWKRQYVSVAPGVDMRLVVARSGGGGITACELEGV